MTTKHHVQKIPLLNQMPNLQLTTDVGSIMAPWIGPERVSNPYRMTLVVSRSCNSRCQMCNIWQQKDMPQLSLEQLETIFSANDFSFLRSVTITGGEPTMRKDLPQVLEKVVDGCPNIEEIYLATSALNTERTIRFVDEMMAIASSRLHSFKRFEVQISLDGVDEVHDEVRGIKGFFGRIEKTIAGLRAIQARMPALRIRLSTVILPNNIDDVDNLRRYAAQANLPIQFVPVVISGSYYENEPDKEHILDASNQHGTSTEQSPSDNETTSKVADFFTDLAQTEQSAMRFHYEDLVQMFEGNHRSRQCMMGYYDFVLEHNADIYSCVNCEDYLFGNLLESSFEDVWFGEQATKARNQLRTDCCPTCPSPCHYPPVGVGELVRSRVNALSKRWSNE